MKEPDRVTITLNFKKVADDKSLSQSLSQDDLTVILSLMREPVAAKTLREKMGFKDSTYFKNTYLAPLLADGVIACTHPDKPTSSAQKYYLTEKGRDVLQELSKTKR